MIPNIGPRGQDHRRRFGFIALAAGVVLGMTLLMLGAPRGWRAMAVVPLWIGALGVFQARDKT